VHCSNTPFPGPIASADANIERECGGQCRKPNSCRGCEGRP
jgi:hypothetical protein